MLNKVLLNQIDQIIAERHLIKKRKPRRVLRDVEITKASNLCLNECSTLPIEIIEKPKLDPTFMETLFKIIDERQLKDSDVYNRAGIDRKVFSKIRNNSLKVSKNNAIALCLALELDINEVEDLLSKAGYALSKSSMRDVIIRQCINNNIYEINEIDEYLIHYEQKTIIKY